MRLRLLSLLFLTPFLLRAQEIKVQYEQFKLKNGLNVILHRDATVPQVSVNVWYHVGSGNEKIGRTGFAHLFEHILFEGSQHVPEGKFDQWLEAAGANNNGSTTEDRTNYYEDMPSNAVDLALFLESDRMGFLAPIITEQSVNGQRDVVKNERRQSYENQPYGKAQLEFPALLYPKGHPYSWPVIGSMEDLTAASKQDVVDFFNTYYTPNNASLCIAGDIDIAKTRKAVEHWFSDVPTAKPAPPVTFTPAVLTEEKRKVMEDKVQLPRLFMIWLAPPAYTKDEASLDVASTILGSGKNSRLYKRLVYELQIAESVNAYIRSKKYGSEFYITATAKPGVTLTQLEKVIQEEIDKLKNVNPDEREMQRVTNSYEADYLSQLEYSGGFSGKANKLNEYYFYTGTPDYFNQDFARYRNTTRQQVSDATRKYLLNNARVVMSVVPEGKKELAAQ